MKDFNAYIYDTHMRVISPDWRWPNGEMTFTSHQIDAVSIDLRELENSKAPLTLAATQEVAILLQRWIDDYPGAQWVPTVNAVRVSKDGPDEVFAKGGMDCPSHGPEKLESGDIAVA